MATWLLVAMSQAIPYEVLCIHNDGLEKPEQCQRRMRFLFGISLLSVLLHESDEAFHMPFDNNLILRNVGVKFKIISL